MKKNGMIRILCCLLTVVLLGMTGCGAKEPEAVLRIGSLKGPTSLGLLFMQDKFRENENWQFTMLTQADELAAAVIRGEVDIALVPANLAAVLYQKTEGAVIAVDINTLGVLYMVSGDPAFAQSGLSVDDLEGRTVYLTGMGTTPDYALQTLLEKKGVNASLEYCSEATEIVALLLQDPSGIGLLPQPFVTSALLQNQDLKMVLDVNQAWEEQTGQGMVTSVTIVRKAYLEENKSRVEQFLKEHEESVKAISEDVSQGAKLAVEAGILPKEEIAKAAIPGCNITCIRGAKVKEMLEPYLTALYEKDPKAVGGQLPDEKFYEAP